MQAANPVQRIGPLGQVAAQIVAIVRGAANWSILVNAASLVGTRVVTSGLGFVYWWLAAHLFTAESIGLAAAVISAMTLLGTIGMLGLSALLIVELPRYRGREGSLIATALLVSAAAGAVLGLVFALGSAPVLPEFASLTGSPLVVALFAVGVGLTALTLVLDQALIGLLRGGVQLTRNAIFSATKLGALAGIPLLLTPSATAIWCTWVFGVVCSLAGLLVLAPRAGASPRRWLPAWSLFRGLRRRAMTHYLLDLSLEAPPLAMPLIVTAVLSPTSNAYFYTASMIAALLAMAPISLANATYAVGAHAPEQLPQRLRFTLALSVLLVAGANVVLFVLADPFLRIFGAAYADEAVWTLRILSLMVFTRIVLVSYDIVCRLRGRILLATIVVGIGGIVELALAAIGGLLGGLTGFALGWLGGACLQAIVMLPTVVNAARSDRADWPEVSENSVQIDGQVVGR